MPQVKSPVKALARLIIYINVALKEWSLDKI